MITLDTSGLFALLDRRSTEHVAAKSVLDNELGPVLVPTAILAEIAYLIEHRLGGRVLDLFLADLESGAFGLDCGSDDIPRIRRLVQRYADLPLGLADASVIACAERNGGRVLTLDRRDFGVVGRDAAISLLPV